MLFGFFKRAQQVTMSNFPNPFTAGTTIRYTLPQAGRVWLRVFDVRGREVTELVGQVQAQGDHYVTWDGRSYDGSRLASGLYVARLEFDDRVQTRKIVRIN